MAAAKPVTVTVREGAVVYHDAAPTRREAAQGQSALNSLKMRSA